MTLILVAFVFNVLKHIKATDKAYLWLNCIGSFTLIVYAILLSSIPFMILNIVWTGAALVDVPITPTTALAAMDLRQTPTPRPPCKLKNRCRSGRVIHRTHGVRCVDNSPPARYAIPFGVRRPVLPR